MRASITIECEVKVRLRFVPDLRARPTTESFTSASQPMCSE